MDSLALKRHYSFQNKNNRKHSFASRPIIFKLQQDLKFNDIYVSWSSPKKWPGAELLKLRELKFWPGKFFSIVTFN